MQYSTKKLKYVCVSVCVRPYPCRPGQNRVPAEPREPGDLPEGLRPNRTLLWSGGGGRQPGPPGGPHPGPVPVPAAGGTHGGVPALTSHPGLYTSETAA